MSFETVKIKVSLNGMDCKNPKIVLVGYEGNIYVNCINEACGEYEVQFDNTQGDRCFTFSVTCSNCTTCKAKLITKCLCDTNGDCPDPCDFCDNGVCNPKCAGACEAGICLEGCIECVAECPDGKICTPYIDNQGRSCRRCGCPPGKKENIFGDCVDCLTATDCPNCFDCLGETCKPKDCGSGVCDPSSNKCEECVNSGDCGTNECCIGKKCQCCTGYTRDLNGICVPKPPCIEDEDCGSCEVCKNKICVPKECPNGQVCDNNECKQSCDCSNPGSCGINKVCRNKGTVCVCESCGICTTGCAEGCIDKCSQGQGCVVNPCTGNCTNGAQCGPGCGCNRLTGKCESCSLQTCATNCGNVLGCECIGSTCGKPETKCVGNCDDSFDCGPGCTCYLKKCVPCSYFSCSNGDCSSRERCKCVGNTCSEDQSAKCNDTLEIVKNDSSCTIDAILTTSKPCGCPVITVKLSDTASSSGSTLTHNFLFELFKGNTTDANKRIDQTSTPGIADNETPLTGSVTVKATVNYTTGISSVIEQSSPVALVGFANVSLSLPAFNYNHGTQDKPKFVHNISLIASISETTYPNTCEYIPASLASTFVTDNTTTINGIAVMSSNGTKLPLFTWWKSANGVFTDKLKDIYVSPTGNVYKDTLVYPEAESCYDYKVETDCGCADAKAKKIVFCSPSSWKVTFESCNKIARVKIPAPCTANRNSRYVVEVDGVDEPAFTVGSAGLELTIGPKSLPIKSVKLKMLCDSSDLCTLSVNAPALPDLTPVPTYTCEGGVPIWKFQGPYTRVNWNGIWNIMPDSEVLILDGVSGVSYSYIVEFKNGCSNYESSTEVAVCCKAIAPEVVPNCSTNKYTVTNVPTSGVLYSLDGTYNDNITTANIQNITIFDAIDKKLFYKSSDPSSNCNGTVSLPSKLTCCSTVSPRIINQTSTSVTIELTQVTGIGNYTVEVSPSGSLPQSILNLIPSTPQSVTFNGLTNGTYNIFVKNIDNPNCGLENRSITIGPCVTTTTLAYNNCNIEASTTGTCACKDVIWEPKILNVAETPSGIEVVWESKVIYQDAQIIDGVITVNANTQNYTINAQGYASGIAIIPCTSSVSKIGTIVIDIDRIDRQSLGQGDVTVYINSGFTISSVTVNGIPATQYGTFNNIWKVPDTFTTTNDFVIVVNSPSFLQYTSPVINAVPLVGSYGNKGDLEGSQANCPSNRVVTFTLNNLKLEDNCSYAMEQMQYVINGTTIPSPAGTSLIPVNRYSRYPKYLWLENNTLIKTEFNAVKSILDGKLLDINKINEVYASCTCDTNRVLIDSCLSLPTFSTVTSADCGSSVDFIITGGCYTTSMTVNIGSDSIGPFNYDPSIGYTGTLNLSSPLTDSAYIYGRYVYKAACEFNKLVNVTDYEVIIEPRTCGVGLGSLTSCASTERVAQIIVKKNGVTLAYTPTNYSINSVSPAATIVTYNNGSYIGCLSTATQYTFNVVAEGCTLPQTYTPICSGSCSVTDYQIVVPTGDNRPCIGDPSTTVVIQNVTGSSPTSLEYAFNGGGFSNFTSGQTLTISSYNASPLANTVIVRKIGEGSCGVEKTFFISERDCSTPPAVNCNLSANKPVITITSSESGITGCKTAGGSGSTPTITISGGTAPYTWRWSSIWGAALFNGTNPSSPDGSATSVPAYTINYVSFSQNQLKVRFFVETADGCSATREWTIYNNVISCASGSSACPGPGTCANTNTCCPNGQCNGVSCCPTGTTKCALGQCCPSGQVCFTETNGSKSCKTIGDPCGTCGGVVLANGTCSGPTCSQGRQCCGGQCLYFDTIANCGACGNSCGSGQSCCPNGGSYQCVTTNTDANCGSCGNTCLSGSKCCGGTCTNITSSTTNCGACGNACNSPLYGNGLYGCLCCTGGSCVQRKTVTADSTSVVYDFASQPYRVFNFTTSDASCINNGGGTIAVELCYQYANSDGSTVQNCIIVSGTSYSVGPLTPFSVNSFGYAYVRVRVTDSPGVNCGTNKNFSV